MNKNNESHSQKETRRFECLKCDKSFLYKFVHLKHMKKHEKEKSELETILVNSLDKDEAKIEKNLCTGLVT